MPDTITLIVQYTSSGRYVRDKGKIIEVIEDDNEPRPPKNGFINPDVAGRIPEAQGYRFDPKASRWLDRRGTTVRPRRKQVFRMDPAPL